MATGEWKSQGESLSAEEDYCEFSMSCTRKGVFADFFSRCIEEFWQIIRIRILNVSKRLDVYKPNNH
jgi:hypothetical protein